MPEYDRAKQIEVVSNDKFICDLVGIKIDDVAKGFARVSLVLRENHLNGVGIVQGGVIYSLADYAFAAASNYCDGTVVGVESSISFIRSIRTGKIFAEAEEVDRSRSFSVCRARVFDEAENLLAIMNCRGYILKPKN
jgi:acyl-CoA thioesterase